MWTSLQNLQICEFVNCIIILILIKIFNVNIIKYIKSCTEVGCEERTYLCCKRKSKFDTIYVVFSL